MTKITESVSSSQYGRALYFRTGVTSVLIFCGLAATAFFCGVIAIMLEKQQIAGYLAQGQLIQLWISCAGASVALTGTLALFLWSRSNRSLQAVKHVTDLRWLVITLNFMKKNSVLYSRRQRHLVEEQILRTIERHVDGNVPTLSRQEAFSLLGISAKHH